MLSAKTKEANMTEEEKKRRKETEKADTGD